MKQKIGIVELYNHSEVLLHYCDLLMDTNYQISVFCKDALFLDLPEKYKKSEIEWHLISSLDEHNAYLNENKANFQDCKFLIITTVFSHFRFFNKLALLCDSIIVMHSAHTWFRPFQNIALRKNDLLFDLLRLVRFIVSGQYFWRRKLLSNVSFIGLPNKAILEYVEDNIPESKKYNIVSFPFAMSSEDFPQKENNKSRLTFTIPGSLSDDVRDYISVLNVIKSISVILKNPIKVVLLGRPRDNFGINTLALFTELELPLIEIKTFSEYISQDSFDKHLRDSDFLILPLKEYTQFGVFREITCKSKLSGSINDVIKSGIPTIASHYCTVDKEVDKNFIYYRSQEEMEMEILKINQNWNDNMPETSTMKRFTNFTKEKLLQDFNDIISSL